MIDETTKPAGEGVGSSTGDPRNSANPVVAFCQQCGRPLTAAARRQVDAGTFCEPCATIRSARPTDWKQVNDPVAGARTPSTPSVTAEPNPVLGGFLGLIPGVGAMYNGQYPKGVIHLIVFVVLVSLADNLNWVFWWFVWGWVFYQAFEAYHTAQARRDGQPLPDAFGWNELGDRFGFPRTSPPVARPAYTRTPNPPVPGAQPDVPREQGFPAGTAPFTAHSAYPLASEDVASVPPGFGTPGPVPSGYSVPPVNGPPFTAVPYTSTFTGGVPPISGQPVFVVGSRRFPAGAAWLIGLGVLFLLGNLLPTWRIDGRWFVPILLAAIALWIGGRRLTLIREVRTASVPSASPLALPSSLAAALLWPGILLTLAVLLAFQDAGLLPLRHSWPALLIVWGAMLFLQRVPEARGDADANAVRSSSAPSSADAPRP